MSVCRIEERDAGRSYPRTCPTCKLTGSCAKGLDRKGMADRIEALEAKLAKASGIKRHEHKLPLANWLRDEINEILAKYDIPSDAYERDVCIDALCVIAVDKIEPATLAELTGGKDD